MTCRDTAWRWLLVSLILVGCDPVSEEQEDRNTQGLGEACEEESSCVSELICVDEVCQTPCYASDQCDEATEYCGNGHCRSLDSLECGDGLVETPKPVMTVTAKTGTGAATTVGSKMIGNVYARLFDTSDSEARAEFEINDFTSGEQRYPSIAFSPVAQRFAVAWTSAGPDGDGDGIALKILDASGASISEELQVNRYAEGSQAFPQVCWIATEAGGAQIAVIWSSDQQDGSGRGVFLQRLASDGALLGAEP